MRWDKTGSHQSGKIPFSWNKEREGQRAIDNLSVRKQTVVVEKMVAVEKTCCGLGNRLIENFTSLLS